MILKPWREVVKPHEDVISGEAKMADFAASLMEVVNRKAPRQYKDPALFYQYTYITEGTKTLLLNVARRISGIGGDPVIQLQTGFGGGKTHSMLAVYHMVKGEVPSDLLYGLNKILSAENLSKLPACHIAVIDGVHLGPNQPKEVLLETGETLSVKTLWGVLAAFLGGESAYELVRASDDSGTSPGKEVLTQLLRKFSPSVILVDELVAYIRQFNENERLLGGTYASNLSFIQALTEAVREVPTAVLLASLPESVREVGEGHGERTLEAVSHYFARIQTTWKPVDREESFEIVRRRLFDDPTSLEDRDATCEAFCRMYATEEGFPNSTREASYRERMIRSYPIHPEVFDQLYTQWTTLERFQKTRGVLKMMSNAIHYLWSSDSKELLVMPADMPLEDSQTQGLLTEPLSNTGWPNIISTDIDGEHSEAFRLDRDKFGNHPIARRIARTIFLATAPGTTNNRSLKFNHLLLGTIRCEERPALVKDALRDMCLSCHYLYRGEENTTWFSITPNLTTEVKSRREKFRSPQQTMEEIRGPLLNALSSQYFRGIHVFAESGDIPDDESLRLVVAPINQTWQLDERIGAKRYARDVLEHRGQAQRINRNRLIFLACETGQANYLREEVATLLAWRSIKEDVAAHQLNVDVNSLDETDRQIKNLTASLRKLVSDSFTRVMSPTSTTGFKDLEWEDIRIQPGSDSLGNRIIEALIESENLIPRWASIHLDRELSKLYWTRGLKECHAEDFWQVLCREMYVGRLTSREVLREAIGNGTEEFFGIAQGKKDDGSYAGVEFGRKTNPVFDTSLLILKKDVAETAIRANMPSVDCRKITDAICELAESQWNKKIDVYVKDILFDFHSHHPEWSLKNIQDAISLGTEQKMFGLAQKKSADAYVGLTFGAKIFSMPLPEHLLVNPAEITVSNGPAGTAIPPVSEDDIKRSFYCTIEISSEGIKSQLIEAAEAIKVILQPGIKTKIQLDVSASKESGFTEQQIRSLKENLPHIGCEDWDFS